MTKTEIIRKFDPNRNFSKFSQKIGIFRKFWNQNFRNFEIFSKIWLESKFSKFSNIFKSQIFSMFDQNRKKIWPKSKFFRNLTKIGIFRNFRKFWPKWKFFVNFHQNPNFSKMWPESKFFENFFCNKIEIFVNFDQNRNFSKIWPKSKFFENFNQIEIFRKFPKSKFFEIFEKNRNFFQNFDQNRNFSKFSK